MWKKKDIMVLLLNKEKHQCLKCQERVVTLGQRVEDKQSRKVFALFFKSQFLGLPSLTDTDCVVKINPIPLSNPPNPSNQATTDFKTLNYIQL
jgi:hypothetical protein